MQHHIRLLLALTTASLVPTNALAAPPAPTITDTVTTQLNDRTLTVEGTRHDDVIVIDSPASEPAMIVVNNGFDGDAVSSILRDRVDRIVVHGRAGNDTIIIDGAPGSAAAFSVRAVLRGDGGNDYLQGGTGNDSLDGGPGFDVLDARHGDDTITGGPGDDHILWVTSDGSDHVDGGSGLDTISITGDDQPDNFGVSGLHTLARVTHTIEGGGDAIDVRRVETINLNTLEGSDTVDIGDLSRTDVRTVNVDDGTLAGGDTPDESSDHVRVSGTDRRDHITISGDSRLAQITGLPSTTNLIDLGTDDTLTIVTRAGDIVDPSNYAIDAARLQVQLVAG